MNQIRPANTQHNFKTIFAGVIAVGLFSEDPYQLGTTSGRTGLFKGIIIIFYSNVEITRPFLYFYTYFWYFFLQAVVFTCWAYKHSRPCVWHFGEFLSRFWCSGWSTKLFRCEWNGRKRCWDLIFRSTISMISMSRNQRLRKRMAMLCGIEWTLGLPRDRTMLHIPWMKSDQRQIVKKTTLMSMMKGSPEFRKQLQVVSDDTFKKFIKYSGTTS